MGRCTAGARSPTISHLAQIENAEWYLRASPRRREGSLNMKSGWSRGMMHSCLVPGAVKSEPQSSQSLVQTQTVCQREIRCSCLTLAHILTHTQTSAIITLLSSDFSTQRNEKAYINVVMRNKNQTITRQPWPNRITAVSHYIVSCVHLNIDSYYF